jgi:aspartyl-tRNA synthetase
LRDEDLRADRQLEFTQLDLEMSFIEEDDILDLVEKLYIELAQHFKKKVHQKPFPRFTAQEVLKKFGSEKFDLREKKDKDILAFAWIKEFPLFVWKKEEKRWDAVHHPFTAPKKEDLPFLKKGDYGKVRAYQYDLVGNGVEIGGGSLRITDPKLQEKVFEIMGHTKEQIKKKFGHLLKAYKFGGPPHGGIALGLDRLVAIFAGEESIREVIAFPVTSSGQTSVMEAPSQVDPQQLRELKIKVLKNK